MMNQEWIKTNLRVQIKSPELKPGPGNDTDSRSCTKVLPFQLGIRNKQIDFIDTCPAVTEYLLGDRY